MVSLATSGAGSAVYFVWLILHSPADAADRFAVFPPAPEPPAGDASPGAQDEIENKSDTDLDSVAVTILCKKDDKIVYGTTTFVDDLKSGDKKAFEVSEYNVPEHDSYEISAQSW